MVNRQKIVPLKLIELNYNGKDVLFYAIIFAFLRFKW